MTGPYGRNTVKEPFLIMVPTASSPGVGTLFIENVKASDGAPEGVSLITAFIATHSYDFASWSDDRLIGVVRDLVERLFAELRGGFRAGSLTRWSYASHQGEVGYYTALQRFLNSYPAHEPVQVAGDYLVPLDRNQPWSPVSTLPTGSLPRTQIWPRQPTLVKPHRLRLHNLSVFGT
jgi:protoporphyrinogen oxidase